MTNLYDFLRRVLAAAETPDMVIGADISGCGPSISNKYLLLNDDEIAWIRQYMTSPEHELHFKSRQVGYDPEKEEPVMAYDFAISGNGFEIFALLCEAVVQNYQFAEIVMKAASFYRDHIPTCQECQKRHFGAATPVLSWDFSPHKPQT